MTKQEADILVAQARPFVGKHTPASRFGISTIGNASFDRILNPNSGIEENEPENYQAIGVVKDATGSEFELPLRTIIRAFQ
jgi:hypothetical protein